MSQQSIAGRVINMSSQPVYVIWDEGSGKNKVWNAKPLAPGRQTPKKLDIDGVTAFNVGDKIYRRIVSSNQTKENGTDQWWWLTNGANIVIRNRKGGGLVISQLLDIVPLQELKIVSDSEVYSWNTTWEIDVDNHWGEKAELSFLELEE